MLFGLQVVRLKGGGTVGERYLSFKQVATTSMSVCSDAPRREFDLIFAPSSGFYTLSPPTAVVDLSCASDPRPPESAETPAAN